MSDMTRSARMGRRRLGVALAMAAVLLANGAAFAGPPAKASFEIRVIAASKGAKPKMDPKLSAMARELKPFRGQYNQFHLVRQQTLALTKGQGGAVLLSPGRQFRITMLGFAAGKARRVRYEVQLPHTKMKRSVAPGARTLDVTRSATGLTIVSTTVR